MRRLIVFNNLSPDGFFADMNSDISWIHKDAELAAFAAEIAKAGGTLLFGRKTYELMAGDWPKPVAVKNDPVIAERMHCFAEGPAGQLPGLPLDMDVFLGLGILFERDPRVVKG